MNDTTTHPESDAASLQEILFGHQSAVLEDRSDRPRRQAIMQQQTRSPSGRFVGIIGPLSCDFEGMPVGAFSGASLAVCCGIAPLLEAVVGRCAAPNCPECGARAIFCDGKTISTLWSDYGDGVLLAGVRLPPDVLCSAEALADLMDYWEAQRIFDGERLWNRDQVAGEWADTASDSALHVILDSAALPVSPGFELQLRALVERVQGVQSSPLEIFVRDQQGSVRKLGEVAVGWYCGHCRKRVLLTPHLARFIASTPTTDLPHLSATELSVVFRQADGFNSALENIIGLLERAGLSNLPLDFSVSTLNLADRYLLKIVAALAAGITDTVFFLDDVPELFDRQRRLRLDDLVGELRKRHNRCVTLGIEKMSSELNSEEQEQEKARDVVLKSEEFQLELPTGSVVRIAVDSSLAFQGEHLLAGFAGANVANTQNCGWRRIIFRSISDLRRESDESLASEVGLIELLINLIELSPLAGSAGVTVAKLKKIVCRRCLGGGMIRLQQGEEQRCFCQVGTHDQEALLSLLIKGRSYRSWLSSPLRELAPLFRGYAQGSALVQALISLGMGSYSLDTLFANIPDLERQMARIVATLAGTERDLYRRTRNRREAASRLVLFTFPFLGLTPERALIVEQQLAHFVLPDDTVAYLDFRVRFKNHPQRVMVPV